MKSNITISAGQIAEFHERGFISLNTITASDEVNSLRSVFTRLFEDRAGRDEGAHFDMMTHDNDDQPAKLPEIINPVNFAPELRTIQYRTNALAIPIKA
jgi:hypothetical protein